MMTAQTMPQPISITTAIKKLNMRSELENTLTLSRSNWINNSDTVKLTSDNTVIKPVRV